MPWNTAIVRTAMVPLTDLTPHPANWRVHPAFQRQTLDSLLDSVGWVDDVLVNEVTGFILDGHLRYELALARGDTEVPVSFVHLSEEQERLVLASLDPITSLALIDREQMAQLAEGLSTPSESVQQVIDGLLAETPVLDAQTKQQVERPAPKPVLSFLVAIGLYRFTVDLETYTTWVNELYETAKGDSETVLQEVTRRLGLDVV